MKILWFTSVELSTRKILTSGTWIPGLYSLFRQYYPEIEIINLTHGSLPQPQKIITPEVKEWIVPQTKKMSADTIKYIRAIIDAEKPDLIEVWGTEDIWGDFPFSSYAPNIPVLLEIQGIVSTVCDEFYGDLSIRNILKCWNLKELIKPSSSLSAIKSKYQQNVPRESKIIKSFSHIAVQSEWSADIIRIINPEINLYRSGIALRQEFYDSDKWTLPENGQIRIFSTALTSQPIKGAFTLFKAFAIVHERYPNAKLVLAGPVEKGIRKSGFYRMLTHFAIKNRFIDAIEFLGPLNAKQISKQYRSASMFINPSFVESYSLVTAEAMYIGCPTIAAYSGAMPELGGYNSVLYFPKGDYRICASHIMTILSNPNIAQTMSTMSISIGSERQNRKQIVNQQLTNYKNLISK